MESHDLFKRQVETVPDQGIRISATAPTWSVAAQTEVTVATLAKGKRVTGSDRDRLAKDLKQKYESGRSIRDLAAETARSYGFVHRILTDGGVKLRGRGGATRRKTPLE